MSLNPNLRNVAVGGAVIGGVANGYDKAVTARYLTRDRGRLRRSIAVTMGTAKGATKGALVGAGVGAAGYGVYSWNKGGLQFNQDKVFTASRKVQSVFHLTHEALGAL